MFEGLRKALSGNRERIESQAPKDQTRREASIPTGVLALGNASFAPAIRKYPLTVVDFWAPWCAPCRMVSPVIEQLSKEYAGRVAFGKVNVDKEKWVAASYKIRSIPTIVVFSRGHSVAKVVGAVPKRAIESKIKPYLGGTSSGRPKSSAQ